MNHPFVDGNKRAGAHIMLIFLAMNGIELRYTQKELYEKCINAELLNHNRRKERVPMEKTSITVEVMVDARIFRQFALFDARRVKRVWRSPLIFVLIMSAFALVCFFMRERSQAVLLGCVLLGVGLILPTVYFGFFLHSIKKQIEKMKLNLTRRVRYIRLRFHART